MNRVVVHPGFVLSKNDGERHFISFYQLCRLYGLDPRKAMCAGKCGYKPEPDDRHVYPKYNGNYSTEGDLWI